MRNSELSGQDKSLLFEIVHGVVRWMGRLDWILNGFYKGQFSKAIPILKTDSVSLYIKSFFSIKFLTMPLLMKRLNLLKDCRDKNLLTLQTQSCVILLGLKTPSGTRTPKKILWLS